MKNFLKYNIPAAVIVLILVIVLAVFGGVNRTAASLAGTIEGAYFGNGDMGSGRYGDVSTSVGAYLDSAKALGALTGDTGDLSAAIAACEGLRTSPYGEADVFLRLADAAGTAYHTYAGSETDDREALDAAKELFASLEAQRKRISGYAEYEAAAERYNRTISGIPGRFLIFGRKEAVLFG